VPNLLNFEMVFDSFMFVVKSWSQAEPGFKKLRETGPPHSPWLLRLCRQMPQTVVQST